MPPGRVWRNMSDKLELVDAHNKLKFIGQSQRKLLIGIRDPVEEANAHAL